MTGKQLINTILQQAIEGRLVPQDPNDEPASVLLDKIRKEKAKLVKEGKLKKKDLEEIPISEDEIPFMIPESWEWCRLGEISTYSHIKKKINASKAAPNIWGLDLEDIEKGGKLLCIKSVGERKAIGDKTCFEEGDILYSKLRPYLLKILIAPHNGICTPEIVPFTCYGDICKGYIVNLLKSVYVDRYINSTTFGIKMPRVATETMVSLIIPLPPLAEQKRIVAKIEELLPKVEKYGKAQESLDKLNMELPERLKKSILQEAIEGRLVPQDPNDESASVLLNKIRAEKKRLVKEGKLKKKDLEETPVGKDEISFEIPQNWMVVRLGEIAEYINGLAFKPDEWEECGIPIIRIQNLTDETRPFNYTSKIFDEKFKIRNGDLLFSWSATLDSFIWKGEEAWLNQHIFKVNSYLPDYRGYLYYALKVIVAKLSDITHGLTMKHLTRGVFENYPIPLPPLAEQKRIVEKIEQLFGEINKLKV